jgi:hypothetical protein
MILQRLFSRWTNRAAAETPEHRLYREAVRQARAPAFYGAGRVADTVEGRF